MQSDEQKPQSARPSDWRDRLHKEVLTRELALFLEGFDPEVAAQLDLTTLTDRSVELISTLPDWLLRRTDLVVEVRTRTGEPRLLVIHIEIQATEQREFGWRMLEYYLMLRQRSKLPVLSYALLLYPATPACERVTYQEGILGLTTVSLTYLQISLPALEAAVYADSPNLLLAIYSTLMQEESSERQAHFERAAARLLEQARGGKVAQERLGALAALLMAYTPVPLSWQELPTVHYDQEVAAMASLIERTWQDELVEKSMAASHAQGRAEGRVETLRQDVRDVLGARFASLPATVEAELACVSDEGTLRRLLIKAATIASLDELTEVDPTI